MSSAGKGKHDTRRGAKKKQADKEITDSDSESSTTSSPIDATNLATQITRQVATMMEEKMLAFSQKLDVITSKFEQNSERITEAENRISRTEDIIVELETKLSDAEGKIDALTHRVDDQEARSRRDNIRIFGVKEGTEGIDALSFFETWLPKVLNLETKKGRIRLDRCHRGLGRPKADSPRVVIIKLHNPSDKMKILTSYSKTKSLELDGAKISIRQDIPPSVVQQRRSFNIVCQQLIEKNIRFRMQFPATLRFSINKKEYSFNTADEARRVVETITLVP